MAREPRKAAKAAAAPRGGKQVRLLYDPASYDRETIVWRFSSVDKDGPWGWRTAAAGVWWSSIFPKLQNFETMTWAAIMAASGGRRRGTNHHPVKVEKLTRQAKNRLEQICQDDVDELFSLRLTQTQRIYGIRDRRALRLLWFDRHHGNNGRAVYPVR